MNGEAARPALVAGLLGLLAGIIGLVIDQSLAGLVAGALALAAGAAGWRIAQRLAEQGAVQRLVEEELRSVRAEARATEAELRAELEASLAGIDHTDDAEDDYYDEGLDPLSDPETGLFSQSFFTVALDSRVAAARRHLRPVAVVLLEVVEGLPAETPKVTEATTVAQAIAATLREADTASRLRTGEFALLLEDTPENGAIWTVERIRRHLAEHRPNLTLWAGIACYPAHAFTPAEMLTAAGNALGSAREWRQDRIEVALAASD